MIEFDIVSKRYLDAQKMLFTANLDKEKAE